MLSIRLPNTGTKLTMEFESQTYTLETSESEVTVSGGEEGRLDAFYSSIRMDRVNCN